MACVSFKRSPVARDLESLSLPAKSIRFSTPAGISKQWAKICYSAPFRLCKLQTCWAVRTCELKNWLSKLVLHHLQLHSLYSSCQIAVNNKIRLFQKPWSFAFTWAQAFRIATVAALSFIHRRAVQHPRKDCRLNSMVRQGQEAFQCFMMFSYRFDQLWCLWDYNDHCDEGGFTIDLLAAGFIVASNGHCKDHVRAGWLLIGCSCTCRQAPCQMAVLWSYSHWVAFIFKSC